MARSWRDLLGTLVRGQPLDADATAWAMNEIMAGESTPAQLSAFIVLLRAKGETADELAGLVQAMYERATPVAVSGRAVDIVGTGGDLAHTVNITTMAAIVVAGSGRRVVKHGNRSASSQCGSADVLEELGIAIDLDATGVATTVEEAGIGFCFAAVFHSGMRHAAPPRREIGIPTVFNVLGPLTNPARPPASAVGCADRRMAPLMAEVFARRGDTALVFRGDDGLDELTTTTTSSAWLAADGRVHETRVDPAAFGLAPAEPDDLRGGDRAYNAGVVRDVVGGKGGPVRDAVLLNAAAAIAVHDGVPDESATIASFTSASPWTSAVALDTAIAAGLDEARRSIDSGAAAEVLAHWAEASQRLRSA